MSTTRLHRRNGLIPNATPLHNSIGEKCRQDLNWKSIHDLLFPVYKDNTLLIKIFNKITKDIEKTVTGKVYFSNVIYTFRSLMRDNFKELLSMPDACDVVRKFQWILFVIDTKMRDVEKKALHINIERYVKIMEKEFQQQQLLLWCDPKYFAKDISKSLMTIWPPKMESIYRKCFSDDVDDDDCILVYLFNLLTRGEIQNLQDECEEMCNAVSFEKTDEKPMYRSVAFIKLLNKVNRC